MAVSSLALGCEADTGDDGWAMSNLPYGGEVTLRCSRAHHPDPGRATSCTDRNRQCPAICAVAGGHRTGSVPPHDPAPELARARFRALACGYGMA
jgi:hypothetical protein